MPFEWASIASQNLGKDVMTENLDLLNTAVSLLIRAALLAARFSGRVRQRSLTHLATMKARTHALKIPFLENRARRLSAWCRCTRLWTDQAGQPTRRRRPQLGW